MSNVFCLPLRSAELVFRKMAVNGGFQRIRRVLEDNLGIISVFSPSKHMLWIYFSPFRLSVSMFVCASVTLVDFNTFILRSNIGLRSY